MIHLPGIPDPSVGGIHAQLVVIGLGHDKPTFLLTNDLPKRYPARQVIMDYAGRSRVEHNLGEKITFFPLDYLAGEVRLNVNFELVQLATNHMVHENHGAGGRIANIPDRANRRPPS